MTTTESIGLEQAKLYLATRIRTRTPLGAAEYLDVALTDRGSYDKWLEVALNCMEIYRGLFPEEWGHSTSPYLSTQREQELYRLVNDGLFPLMVSESDDVEAFIRQSPQFRLQFIPMRGLQRHLWMGGRFNVGEIETAFRVAAVLAKQFEGGESWSVLRTHYDLQQVPEPADPLAAVGWSLFVYSCQVEDSPLCYLPMAFNMISYKTGNPWLDLPPVGLCGFAWSLEKIIELSIGMVRAQQIGEDIVELSTWLEEDPAPRIARVVELWNDAASKEVAAGGEGLIHDEETGELYRREDWWNAQETEMVRA